MNARKDTIYLEPDDEITAVIDKLQQSPQAVVALVLPQRASVFQSIVNMKLLKRAATKSRKQVALVTSDATVTKLAGLSGMYIAKTLQSKPEIPEVDKVADTPVDAKEDTKTGGAPKEAVAAAVGTAVMDDAIELDNSTPKSSPVAVVKSAKKKIKIPDFGSFRNRLFLGGALLLLLIVGSVFAFVIAPKATVRIKTDTKGVDIAMTFLASASAKDFNEEQGILPAGAAEVSKVDTEKVPATGEKNIGETAKGSVSMSAKVCSPPLDTPKDVPAGSTVTSNGKSFTTQKKISFSFSGSGGGCFNFSGGSTDITANGQGSGFNIGSGSAFAVSGRADVSATGSASGGTDEIVKIVSQGDIDTAKQRLVGRSKAAALDELKAKLSGLSLKALEQTLDEGEPKLEPSAAVGAEASEVTVTSTTVYKMLGVREDQLQTLLNKSITVATADTQQKIQDNGLAGGTFTVTEKAAPTEQRLQLKTVATVGPDMNIDQIKQIAAGKKRSEIQDEIGKIEGVKEVTVTYSPFWVLQTPKSPGKINVVLEQQN